MSTNISSSKGRSGPGCARSSNPSAPPPLRERIVGLPIEVEYVEDEGVEAVVEANATQIATGLRPWAELLASFEA